MVQGKKGAVLRGADGSPRPEWTYAKAAVGYETFLVLKDRDIVFLVFGHFILYYIIKKHFLHLSLGCVTVAQG